VIKRLARLQYRFYDRMRHPDAFRTAREPGAASNLEALRGHHYCLVVTFRRSGEPVPTAVLFGLADGKLYFRTEPDVGKVKRIRNDARVRVGPCNWRGKPLGPLVEGTARVLPAAEKATAYAALRANYTFGQRLYEGALDRLPVEIVYVEVVPKAVERVDQEAA
jgi:PPOX class probable F420-dependent enzyme